MSSQKYPIYLALVCSSFILAACQSTASSNNVQAEVKSVSSQGEGLSIGHVSFKDTPQGLLVQPQLSALPPGPHGFHIHATPSCATANNAEGKATPAQAAGGHLDPHNTGKHLGPQAHGHAGDLPLLQVAANGTATTAVLAPNLRLSDVRQRAIMVHAGSDNYSDQPQALGGGGARIACGIIP